MHPKIIKNHEKRIYHRGGRERQSYATTITQTISSA
jgi:hypothetical protein